MDTFWRIWQLECFSSSKIVGCSINEDRKQRKGRDTDKRLKDSIMKWCWNPHPPPSSVIAALQNLILFQAIPETIIIIIIVNHSTAWELKVDEVATFICNLQTWASLLQVIWKKKKLTLKCNHPPKLTNYFEMRQLLRKVLDTKALGFLTNHEK